MKTVGIKVLKDNLSRYLKLVRTGEVVLVADRDEVIAKIIKPGPEYWGQSKSELFFQEQEKKGALIRATRKKSLCRSIANNLSGTPHFSAQKVLEGLRKDRF